MCEKITGQMDARSLRASLSNVWASRAGRQRTSNPSASKFLAKVSGETFIARRPTLSNSVQLPDLLLGQLSQTTTSLWNASFVRFPFESSSNCCQILCLITPPFASSSIEPCGNFNGTFPGGLHRQHAVQLLRLQMRGHFRQRNDTVH